MPAITKPVRRRVRLCWPGAKLLAATPPPTLRLFLLLALSTVSFDGMLLTSFWFRPSYNPLESPSEPIVAPTRPALAISLLSAAFLPASGSARARLAQAFLSRVAGFSSVDQSDSRCLIISSSISRLFSHGQYALAALSTRLIAAGHLFSTRGACARRDLARPRASPGGGVLEHRRPAHHPRPSHGIMHAH